MYIVDTDRWRACPGSEWEGRSRSGRKGGKLDGGECGEEGEEVGW